MFVDPRAKLSLYKVEKVESISGIVTDRDGVFSMTCQFEMNFVMGHSNEYLDF